MSDTGLSAVSKKRGLLAALLCTLLLQLGVLAGEYLSAVWPLWYGQPVRLETQPVDPRSLFRGNYVRLNYAISRVDSALADAPFRRHEVVYVVLAPQGEYLVARALRHEPPAQGPFIRGRIRGGSSAGLYRIEYGIEAFFMPKRKALAAQQAVREQAAWAQVYLLDNGKAAIAQLICEQGCQ